MNADTKNEPKRRCVICGLESTGAACADAFCGANTAPVSEPASTVRRGDEPAPSYTVRKASEPTSAETPPLTHKRSTVPISDDGVMVSVRVVREMEIEMEATKARLSEAEKQLAAVNHYIPDALKNAQEVVELSGWKISYEPTPIPDRGFDWLAVHEDYDGPEDGRCLRAPSRNLAIAAAIAWEQSAGDTSEDKLTYAHIDRDTALSEAERLRGELAEAKSDVQRVLNDLGPAVRERDQAIAENARLKADVERMDWLEREHLEAGWSISFSQFYCVIDDAEIVHEDTLRQAIDAAVAAKAQPEGREL